MVTLARGRRNSPASDMNLTALGREAGEALLIAMIGGERIDGWRAAAALARLVVRAVVSR